MKYLAYILALILVLVATGFSMLNAEPVLLHYYLGTVSISLSMALLISLVVGTVFGLIIFLPSMLQLSYSNRKLRQVVQNYESEIRNLRTFPIRDDH